MPRIELRRARWTDGLGLLCLIATLLLLSTGVRVARAGDVASPEGATCEAPESASPAAAASRRAGIRAPEPREPISGVIVLNTRGYNYGPGRDGQAPPSAAPAPAPPAATPPPTQP